MSAAFTGDTPLIETMAHVFGWLFAIGVVLIAAGAGARACERWSEWRSVRKANAEEARKLDWLYQFEQRQVKS